MIAEKARAHTCTRAFRHSLDSDPMTLGLMVGAFAGPEVGQADAFAPENVERVLALA